VPAPPQALEAIDDLDLPRLRREDRDRGELPDVGERGLHVRHRGGLAEAQAGEPITERFEPNGAVELKDLAHGPRFDHIGRLRSEAGP
jgi:hypothetical protein